jgi:hypothetical protein
MADEKDQAGAKPNYKSRSLLNPRRLQSPLKRAHEVMLADAKNPQLTHQEKLAYLKAGAEYAKLLAAADGRRRTQDRANRAAGKRLELSAAKAKSPWE